MSDTKKAVADLVSSGVEHYGAGQLREAIDAWERALALDPAASEAREYLGYVRKNFDSLKRQFDGGEVAPLEISPPDGPQETMMGLPLPPSPGSSPGFVADTDLEKGEYKTAGAGQTLLGTPALQFPSQPTTTNWNQGDFDTSDSEQITPERDAIRNFDLDLAPSADVDDDADVGTLERSQAIPLSLDAPLDESDDEEGTFPRPSPIELGDLMLGSIDDDPETHDGQATAVRGQVSEDTIDLGAVELIGEAALPDDEEETADISLMDALRNEMLESIRSADPGGNGDDAVRARIEALIEKAQEENRAGRMQKAVVAAILATEEAPANIAAQKVIHAKERELIQIFAGFLGSLASVPQLAVELSALSSDINSRDAFLLTRVDGMLSYGDIIDISGMDSLAAHKTLCRFLVDGVIRA